MTDGMALAEGALPKVAMPRQARWRFNQKPKDTVQWLMSGAAFAEDAASSSGKDDAEGSASGGGAGGGGGGAAPLIGPAELAQWFLTEEGLSTEAVGAFLGGSSETSTATLAGYVGRLSLGGLTLDTALRYFLSLFRLPGEAQQIDRILQAFAEAWAAANPSGGVMNADVAYVLSFSLIMLNTDLHSNQIVHKMTLEQWLSNNRGIGIDGADLPRALLEQLYAAVKSEEIRRISEETKYIRGAVREGWLVKQGGRIKTWRRRWVVLASGGVLYYFDDPKAAAPKGVLPLEDVIVRASSERPFAFILSHSESAGGRIKSAKAAKSGATRGSLVQGHHAAFLFAADSEEERQRWMRALKMEATVSRTTSFRRASLKLDDKSMCASTSSLTLAEYSGERASSAACAAPVDMN